MDRQNLRRIILSDNPKFIFGRRKQISLRIQGFDSCNSYLGASGRFSCWPLYFILYWCHGDLLPEIIPTAVYPVRAAIFLFCIARPLGWESIEGLTSYAASFFIFLLFFLFQFLGVIPLNTTLFLFLGFNHPPREPERQRCPTRHQTGWAHTLRIPLWVIRRRFPARGSH